MANYVSSEVSDFLNRLNKVKKNGENWSASCPCRADDDNPSLSIGQGNDGRVLVTCHRGIPCSLDEICDAVGIKPADLYPKIDKSDKKSLQLVATYDYTDENNVLLFQKLRFIDENGKKTFRQRRPDGSGWAYNLNGVKQVLFNLPEVLQAKEAGHTIFVVEGEKDALTLKNEGLVATTMPGGAGKWLSHHTEALAGATVVVISDNDEVGRQHASEVGQQLAEANCKVTIKIPVKVKDVSDLLGNGGSLHDLIDFTEIAEKAPKSSENDEIDKILSKISQILDKTELSNQVKVSKCELVLHELLPQTSIKPTGRLVEWGEFVEEEENDSYDWVIPNLLERGERVMVVAAEGVGKTFLARQVALMTAAGIHPFTLERMKPIRTLTIDLENPQRIIRRTSRAIYINSKKYGFCAKPEAHLLIKPDGIDLMTSTDRRFIEDAIEQTEPDLIFLGPIYKSFVDPGGRTSESVAIEVAKYFDSLREWFNCSFWLEHHAPLGSSITSRDLRPFGSAVWSRWPEFGLSLQPDPTATEGYVYEIRHFRGARDKRQFPTRMKRGTIFPFEVIDFARMD
jgi:5S rRNA maturation endonuclease (ribonuclease M5)